MRILLISDDHGRWAVTQDILSREVYDCAFHLGDSEQPESVISQNFQYYVGGNHDSFTLDEACFELDGARFLLCHGHCHGISVFSVVKPAIKSAKKRNATIIVHGHTHVPQHINKDNIDIICPGSVAHGRSAMGNTYAILEICDGLMQNVTFKQVVKNK